MLNFRRLHVGSGRSYERQCAGRMPPITRSEGIKASKADARNIRSGCIRPDVFLVRGADVTGPSVDPPKSCWRVYDERRSHGARMNLRRLHTAYGCEVREGARYARTAIRLIDEMLRRRGIMSQGGET